MVGSKDAHFMPGRKQKERERERWEQKGDVDKIYPLELTLNDPLSPTRPHFPKFPPPPINPFSNNSIYGFNPLMRPEP